MELVRTAAVALAVTCHREWHGSAEACHERWQVAELDLVADPAESDDREVEAP
jgi:hypothetical protein